MFKALDARDNSEITILDPRWMGAIEQLRELGRGDYLVCQGCRQPVRVRAVPPGRRRPHFAHKHLANCDFQDISPILRKTRAVLYEWLQGKFGENVTIEKKIEGSDLFRPVDCWVTQGTEVFAYWIFDSTLKPEKREAVSKALITGGLHCNWVFAAEMLRRAPGMDDGLILTTTEREFIQHSRYDLSPDGRVAGGSLHYLDAANGKLTTFRCLSLQHEPQIYSGTRKASDLNSIMVSPQNGEFVHDGEYEALRRYEQVQAELRLSPRRRWERHAQQMNPTIETTSPQKAEAEPRHSAQEDESIEKLPAWEPDEPPAGPLLMKKGRCIFCGELTDDWWWYDGRTGECKCQSCKQKGLV